MEITNTIGNKKKIILIACPNGYGHFFRLLEVSNFLVAEYDITLYCSNEQFEKVKLTQKKQIKFRIFTNQVNIKSKYNKYLLKFFNMNIITKQDLKKVDLIISDNLLNHIYQKKRFILMANFLWGETFYNNKKKFNKYQQLEKNFLLDKNQHIIQNKIFSNIQNYNCKKNQIDFIGEEKKNNFDIKKKFNNNQIFIYISNKKFLSKQIEFFLFQNFKIFSNKKIKGANIHKIENGFSEFKYILAKPGLGSIKNSIQYKTPLISYVEKKGSDKSDNEIIRNDKLIKKFNLGLSINKKTFKNICKLSYCRYRKKIKNLGKFNFNGNQQISEIIKRKI